jgi:hypothetical protein
LRILSLSLLLSRLSITGRFETKILNYSFLSDF